MAPLKASTFCEQQWLPFSMEKVFLFFANPQNLPPLMPSWQAARIDAMTLSPPPLNAVSGHPLDPPLAGSGSKVTLSVRPFPLSPVRLSWDALIEDFEWLARFSDVQLKGPFAYWRHTHSIYPEERDGRPGTLLRDEVIYASPFGPLGRLADQLFIPCVLRSTFAHRHRMALELLSR